MKKIFSLLCVCLVCGLASAPGMAAKGGSCSPTKAVKIKAEEWLKKVGKVVGGGIGWATGGAVGASLAPFALIGRGGIDPVVGTLKINGTILAGFVGGAAVGSYAGGKIAGKVYSGQDYLCYNGDLNNCLQCDVHFMGSAYECGDEHVVFGPGFAFRCNSSLNPFVKDRWEEFKIPRCSGSKVINDGSFDIDVRSSLNMNHPSMPGWTVVNRDVCFSVDCSEGWTYNSGKQICEEVVKPAPKQNQNQNPNPQRQKSCREKNKNAGSKRLACCDVEVSETGFWRNNDCYCNDPGYVFEIVNGDHGQCVPKTTNPEVIPDNKPKCTDNNNMDEDCNCKPQYTHKNEYGKCVCNAPAELVGGKCTCDHIAGAKFENGYCKCGKNKEISGDKCDWTKEHMDKLLADVESKYSKIKSLTAGFKVSEWKDAEGNFNTARLASDSIAGVVLGTVGGVVTSHLVKKAQVKQGFEDIQCHIGGQSVASFGDEFVVGR